MSNMKGAKSVFHFTTSQYWSRNGFKRTTILIALLLLLGATALTFFTGRPKSKKTEEKISLEEIQKNQKTILVLNTTDLPEFVPDEAEQTAIIADTESEDENASLYRDWKFVVTTGEEKAEFEKISEKSDTVLAIVEKDTDKDGNDLFRTRVLIPNGSSVRKGEAMDAGEFISDCVQNAVYEKAGIDDAMIQFIMMEPTFRSATTDDDVSLLNMLIRNILPAILGLFLYMLILLHGQTICKEVSIEKTSKLMETMLVHVEPNALILGKTISITVLALGQFLCWVASAVAGLILGNVIGKNMYGDRFVNRIRMVIDFLRDNIGASALSPAAIVMSIIVFCFGVFIYFALAALGGSFVSKPEETSSASSTFVFPLIVFWLITYFASLTEAENLLRVLRFIPFTAPFCVPVDVLTGNMNLVGGAIVCVEVTLVALLLIFLAARIYRGLVLHTGQKLTLKTIWATICGR